METLCGKEETEMVVERIASCIRAIEGMEGGEKALTTGTIS